MCFNRVTETKTQMDTASCEKHYTTNCGKFIIDLREYFSVDRVIHIDKL